MNPLFPDEPNQPQSAAAQNSDYVLSHVKNRLNTPSGDAAIDLIRNKIDSLFDDEPNARTEIAEAKAATTPRSRHQQFMFDLSASGKPLAEIQTAWHEYYQRLNDAEKHQVWQEFYAANNQTSAYTKYVQKQAANPSHGQHQPQPVHQLAPQPQQPAIHHTHPQHVMSPTAPLLPRPAVPRARHHEPPHDTQGIPQRGQVVVAEGFSPDLPTEKRSFATIKKHVAKRAKASYNAQVKARQHLQSLIFGIGLGSLVLFVLLFSFFNEVIVAPFIHPNAHAQATPIILNTDGVAPTDKNEVIIPKINVQLPVIYSQTTNEADIQNSLEEGIIHYPTTTLPGQGGNASFFGHSSNNIFNKGKYKFAFVLLHELEPGDIFYVTYNGKAYTYKVFQKKIVEPTDIGVLNPVPDKPATVTLITCDPPGTSLRRLVVWGEQITPDPTGNTSVEPAQVSSAPPAQLPSNSPSLWSRVTGWFQR